MTWWRASAVRHKIRVRQRSHNANTPKWDEAHPADTRRGGANAPPLRKWLTSGLLCVVLRVTLGLVRGRVDGRVLELLELLGDEALQA